MGLAEVVGNQLLILLISFTTNLVDVVACWESVTNPLDKLSGIVDTLQERLGISY